MTTLTSALKRIMRWLQRHNPASASDFLPGLWPEDIEQMLDELPFCVPQEVYELYQWRNGTDIYNQVFVHHAFLDLEEAIKRSQNINSPLFMNVRDYAEEPLYLFPLFDYDRQYLAVPGSDTPTATAPVFFMRNDGTPLYIAFTSLTNMMLALAECYETGLYRVRADGSMDVIDQVKFDEIRCKYNPGAVEYL